MTPLERKVIRKAADIVAEGYMINSVCAIVYAVDEIAYEHQNAFALTQQFRRFYNQHDCPLEDWGGSLEELNTIRILLLETFLIFDGELE